MPLSITQPYWIVDVVDLPYYDEDHHGEIACYVPLDGVVGTDVRFQVDSTLPNHGTYKGEGYSHLTGAIKQVTMVIPSYAEKGTSAIESLSRRYNPGAGEYTNYVRSSICTHQLDFNNLNIYAQSELTLSNRHGEFLNYGGLTALAVEMGWQGYGFKRQFTGYGGVKYVYNRAQAPESTVTIVGQDLSYCCRENESWNLPWMDGWCHFYAIRYLAMLAGIHESRLSALPNCTSPDCGHADHFFLPMGEGGSPLMYFAPGTTYWAAMNRIRRIVGYVMFFDALGYLQYYPWVRTNPGPFKAVFEESPDPANNMRALQSLSLTRDSDAIRNHLTIIGVDAYAPMWRPIIAHRANSASLTSYGARNFVPFKKRAVWADSQFATLEYASDAADALFSVLQLPGEEVTFSALGQPDIYPLDVIGIKEYKTGAYAYQGEVARKFFVTRVTQRMIAGNKTLDYTTTITGRWLV